MFEYIRFGLAAFLACSGAFVVITSLLGVFRFRFALNRMHAAGAVDSLGMLLIISSLIIAFGFSAVSLKLCLVIIFLWITSPVASHLLGRMEVMADEDLEKHVDIEEKKE